MENIRNYGDFRQRGFCVYCGGPSETMDHAPAKVFLDEPYPDQLPCVEACNPCNNGVSDDEEYVACIVECVRVGSAENDDIERPKVRRILDRKPGLREQIRNARVATGRGFLFNIDEQRVTRVIVKLARAHAAYELNLSRLSTPSTIHMAPLCTISPDAHDAFEQVALPRVWPEVGSRGLQRAVIAGTSAFLDWIEVQPERYRYLAFAEDDIVVRLVLNEYLAGEVIWSDADESSDDNVT